MAAQPDADLSSAIHAFDTLRMADAKEPFLLPHFTISRYLRSASASASSPAAAVASHLHGLLSERLGLYSSAVDSLSTAVAGLEAAYEDIESPETERQYIIASISLGRARLAAGEHAEAIEAVDTALGLLPEEFDASDVEPTLLRAQGCNLKALASFFSGEAEMSLQQFEEARSSLEMAGAEDTRLGRVKTQTTLLVAGVLHSIGGEDQLAQAESLLLET